MRSFSEIQPGMLLTGYVRNVMPFGVFVEFPFGVTGLAPKVVSNASTSVGSMCVIRLLETVLAKVQSQREINWAAGPAFAQLPAAG